MTAPESVATVPGDPHLPLIAQQALSRSSGAQFIGGNAVRVLRDSTENYPAWLAAIAAARRMILFENYIIGRDEIGREFVAALAAKAREGVRVWLVYDWVGTPLAGKLFRPLLEAGGQVRCFNPPRLAEPFGWLSRDHRKMIAVDGEVAFVAGLCVAKRWTGARGQSRRGATRAWKCTALQSPRSREPSSRSGTQSGRSLWTKAS